MTSTRLDLYFCVICMVLVRVAVHCQIIFLTFITVFFFSGRICTCNRRYNTMVKPMLWLDELNFFIYFLLKAFEMFFA